MGFFDAIRTDKSKKENEPTPADIFLQKRKPLPAVTIEHKIVVQRPEEREPNEPEEWEPNEPEEDEPDEPLDFATLAKTGTEMEINEYIDSDYTVVIKVVPNTAPEEGSVIVTCDYSEDEDVKDIKELGRTSYKISDVETLKSAILSAVKGAKRMLQNEQTAYEVLDAYLDDIEDEVNK